MNEIVFCPLLKREIDSNGLCFDIAMVAEDNSPERFAPEEVLSIVNFKKICLACPNHRYD